MQKLLFTIFLFPELLYNICWINTNEIGEIA